jgi:hypothetical protein
MPIIGKSPFFVCVLYKSVKSLNMGDFPYLAIGRAFKSILEFMDGGRCSGSTSEQQQQQQQGVASEVSE